MARFAGVAHTERGLDRLINFSDAVFAIAATLLVLPIVEIMNDALANTSDLENLLSSDEPDSLFSARVPPMIVGFILMILQISLLENMCL